GAPKPSHVRELLLTLKTRIEAQLNGNGVVEHVGSAGKNGMTDKLVLTDMADTAADLHDTVVERAVQDNIVRQLEQVNETLTRTDDGKYGICANCLQPIAADRLVVRPFSTLCTDCQNQHDRGKLARF
ncbi:MAG: TraR/DksA family transcriptional regulator, partial [Chloroflexi bacterium]|nr:TraR/DksA family transcriptional regulator [Chloroflexota bacterium]